jgi:hypothetical protein
MIFFSQVLVVDFVKYHEKYCPKRKMVVSSWKGYVNVELTKLAGGEELNVLFRV